MTDDQLAEAQSIFEAAAALPPEQRGDFLSERCGHDPALRALVERLLARHEEGIGDFLEVPIAEREEEAVSPGPISRRIGPYEIIRKLGEGGMGTVYLARQEKPKRTVALKVVRIHAADSATLRRFDFEIEVLGQLNHPGIAQIYDAGTDADGNPFFAMEYVAGKLLLKHAESRGLGHRDRLELLARVCDAVHYAHEKGVIHRDLKPGNILVAEAEGAPAQPKILDFGVARAIGTRFQADAGQTRTGTLVGTLAYMSPEQVSGRSTALDVRSDVYQLGVILFELLTGQLPYEVEGLSVTEAAHVIKETEPPQLGSLDSCLRGDITTIVGKALEKDPGRRYAAAVDLANDIRRHLTDEPIAAQPPSATYRIRKFIKRKRNLVGTLGMGLILIIAVTSLLLWGSRNSPNPPEVRTTRIVAEDYGFRFLPFALSPDGQHLAYGGGGNGGGDLILVEISTGEAEILLQAESGRFFRRIGWHPDGEGILTEERTGDRWQTWITNIDSKERELIRGADEPTFPAISPDGSRLAFLSGDRRDVRVESITGGDGSTIVHVSELEQLRPPAWAATGNRLAYTIENLPDTRVTLETTDLAGNRQPVLVDTLIDQAGDDGATRLCWLPDGRLVYNKWTSQDVGELLVVDVDTESGRLRQGPRRLFAMDGTKLDYPSASNDGTRLAFARCVWDRNLVVLEMGDHIRDRETSPLSLSGWTAYPGAWSADSKKFFYHTERKAHDWDIYARELSASREEPVVVAPGIEVVQCLSPDGTKLLYLQDQDLMSLPIGGGESKRILESVGGVNDVAVRCAVAPGSLCVIMELDGPELVVRQFHLDGRIAGELLRVEVELGVIYGLGFDLSPDGSEFVIAEWSGRIRVFDLDTGESKDLANDWGGACQKALWSRDATSLYISGMGGVAPYWIVRLDLEDGYEVLWESEEVYAWWPMPAPDDRRLAFHTTRIWRDIWMIEGF